MDKTNTIEKAMERIADEPGADARRSATPPGSGVPDAEGDDTTVTRAAAESRRPPDPMLPPGPGTRTIDIDLGQLRRLGYITPDQERSVVAEEFRLIKRPILANAFGQNADLIRHGNLIMVTSARAGEGKTFTAINLAMSIAMEMDRTVLLVDADVGRPRVHKVLGTPMGPGLIDLLLDDALDVGDVILRTNVPKLSIIPMGRHHHHSTELLASQDMLRLVDELAGRYADRVVIFDAPPLLLTSEAVVLSGLMGQMVFVVLADRTPRAVVRDALSLLDANKPIGLVLNKTRRVPGDSYGYGYGYGVSGKG